MIKFGEVALNKIDTGVLEIITSWSEISFNELAYQAGMSAKKLELSVVRLTRAKLIILVRTATGDKYTEKKRFDDWCRNMCGVDDPSIYYINW